MIKDIYKITNLINNKIYIGQSVNAKHRWEQHVSASKHNPRTIVDRAIKKYGEENFGVEVIEKTEQYDEQERYWITYYNSTNPDKGYNCTKGGDGNSVAREVKTSTRNKISEANKLKWSNTEYREQQRLSRIESHKRRSKQIV